MKCLYIIFSKPFFDQIIYQTIFWSNNCFFSMTVFRTYFYFKKKIRLNFIPPNIFLTFFSFHNITFFAFISMTFLNNFSFFSKQMSFNLFFKTFWANIFLFVFIIFFDQKCFFHDNFWHFWPNIYIVSMTISDMTFFKIFFTLYQWIFFT